MPPIALEEITVKKTFATLGLSVACVLGPAAAQDYPSRDIRSICNFAPGSGADIIVRFYSDKLAKLTGKPVIVDNKPGANGAIATAELVKSRPDGHTIMITPASSTKGTPRRWARPRPSVLLPAPLSPMSASR